MSRVAQPAALRGPVCLPLCPSLPPTLPQADRSLVDYLSSELGSSYDGLRRSRLNVPTGYSRLNVPIGYNRLKLPTGCPGQVP